MLVWFILMIFLPSFTFLALGNYYCKLLNNNELFAYLKIYNLFIFFLNLLVTSVLFIIFNHFFITKLIKPLQEKNKALEVMAIRDSTTGLYNKGYLLNYLANLAQSNYGEQSKLVVIMIDIDFFKNVNDCYGHLAGDKILTEVAHIISCAFYLPGIVARYGGEEFTIVCSHVSQEEALELAESIRRAVEEAQFLVDESLLHLTVSLGVYVAKEKEEMRAMLEKADYALYQAKTKGRNKVEIV